MQPHVNFGSAESISVTFICQKSQIMGPQIVSGLKKKITISEVWFWHVEFHIPKFYIYVLLSHRIFFNLLQMPAPQIVLIRHLPPLGNRASTRGREGERRTFIDHLLSFRHCEGLYASSHSSLIPSKGSNIPSYRNSPKSHRIIIHASQIPLELSQLWY